VSCIFKHLRNGDDIGQLLPLVECVSKGVGSIQPAARHEGGPRWPANRLMTIGFLEDAARRHKAIKIRGNRKRISIAPHARWTQVVRTNKKNVWGLLWMVHGGGRRVGVRNSILFCSKWKRLSNSSRRTGENTSKGSAMYSWQRPS
jgi:hypothetical protein